MFFALYSSTAVKPFSEEELIGLLETSRRNNLRDDITGMLVYQEGSFLQFLEGPKEKVEALLGKIEADTRHRSMTVSMRGERPGRKFEKWSMGFKRLDPGAKLEIPGYDESLDLAMAGKRFLLAPSRTLHSLLLGIRPGAP